MIFFQHPQDPRIVFVKIEHILIAAVTNGADQHRYRQFAGPINAHKKTVIDIGLEFKPGAAVRDDRCTDQLFPGAGIRIFLEIHSRRTDQLADDNPFGPIDDKGAVVGHPGEIAHKYFLLFHLTRFPVDQANLYLQGDRVGGVPLLAFIYRIFRFSQDKI